MGTSNPPTRNPLHVAIRAVLVAGCLATPHAIAVPDVVPLGTLAGARSLRLDGSAQEKAGTSVAHAGDINGDGFDDLLIGAPEATVQTRGYYGNYYYPTRAGRAYVLFGRAIHPASVSLGAIGTTGTPGFRVEGNIENGFLGRRVAGLGDINNDGFDDFAVAGPQAAVNVVLGAAATSPTLSVSALGTRGFAITGLANGGSNAPRHAISAAGDINGDGFDDIAIGDRYYGNAQRGRTYVVFGRATFPSTIDVGTAPATQVVRFDGSPADRSGNSVATLGDINGDALDDLVIGAPTYVAYEYSNPRAYVVFGRPQSDPFPTLTGLDALGAKGFTFRLAATQSNDISVAGAGDVNGDGRRDMLVGAAHESRGYLVFGAASFPALVSSSSLAGVSGVAFPGESFTGAMVGDAGDHNRDGLADFLVTSPGATGAGRTYVAYGRASFGGASALLTGLSHPLGFRIDGSVGPIDFSKPAISSLPPGATGDLDGDGAPDLVVGEFAAVSNAGRAYVLFASPEVTATPPPSPTAPITFTDFPFDPVGPITTITFANTGGVPLQLAQPAPLAAPFASSFASGNGTLVPQQQSRVLTVGCTIGDEQSLATTTFNSTLLVQTNDPDEPSFSYPVRCDALVTDFDSSPPAGGTIAMSGAPGTSQSAFLVLRGFGPSSLNVHSCTSDSPAFTLPPGLFPLTAPIDENRSIAISCVTPATGATLAANLTCTDINDPDERGASYALRCSGVSGPVPTFSATPPTGGTLAISGSATATSATRFIRVSNIGATGSTLQVSGCAIADSRFSVSPPSLSIAQGAAAQDLTVSCQLPAAAGTTINDNLVCNTNDPLRPVAGFAVSCSRPAAGFSVPQDPLTDPSALEGENFGTAVAIADLGAAPQEVFVVGAPRPLLGSGEVHIFVRDAADDAPAGGVKGAVRSLGKGSAPTAVLRMNGGNLGDKFGASVAISSDGATIVVGAPGRDVGVTDRGTAFVFRRPAGGWADANTSDPAVTLLQPAAGAGVTSQGFGEAVAIGTDNRVVVGAPLSDRAAFADAGTAYVFAPQSGNFAQENEVAPGPGETGALFGRAVAMSAGLLAIGAPEEDEGTSAKEGAVYTFAPNGAVLGAATRTVRASGGIGDKFGASVAIAGNMVVVGASEDDTLSGEASGSATVFMRGAGGALVETTTLEPPLGTSQGAGASVSTNGDVVVLGAPLARVNDIPVGRALVFDLPSTLPVRLTPTAVLENAVAASNDLFAKAVVVGKRHLLVGVPLDEPIDGQLNDDDGRADPYLLDRIFRSGLE